MMQGYLALKYIQDVAMPKSFTTHKTEGLLFEVIKI